MFTDLENKIINKLVDTHLHRPGGYSYFDGGVLDDGIWAICLIDETGDIKTFRGVVSSLIQKGVLRVTCEDGPDKWIELDDLGRQAVIERAAAEAAQAGPAGPTPEGT
jgi:hypothetical protein